MQQLLDLNDEEFSKIKPEWLDGDYPQIWADRPWHPLTRQEIYVLIWACKQLGFVLPTLVLDRIAFWIQLIELCKDLRAGKLLLQLCLPSKDLLPDGLPTRFNKRHWKFEECWTNGKIQLEYANETRDSKSWSEELLADFFEITNCLEEHEKEIEYSEASSFLEGFLAQKDRYRIVIPHRQALDEFLEELIPKQPKPLTLGNYVNARTKRRAKTKRS
jgi:hypothetical protein